MKAINCGAAVKTLLEDSDTKQKTLAAAIGVNQNTFSNYVTGRTSIPYDVLVQIADYFSVTTDFLLGRVKDPSLPYPISPSERAMLAQFRLLTGEQRELILQTIELMSRQNQRR